MATIGKIDAIQKELDIEWRISDFFSLSDEADRYYSSPPFSFNGSSLFLKIYPNGRTVDKSVGYFGLSLKRLSVGLPTSLEFSVSLKKLDGTKDRERHYTCICDNLGSRYVPRRYFSQYGTPWGISRSQLLERRSELMPFNVFTILCTLKDPKLSKDASYIATAECAYCQKLLDVVHISSHEKMCTSQPIKCQKCAAVVLLQNWYGHQCEDATAEGDNANIECSFPKEALDTASISVDDKKCIEEQIKFPERCEVSIPENCQDRKCVKTKAEGESSAPKSSELLQESKILQDFRDMLFKQEDCDVVLRTKTKEFPAHRVILRARSSVFASMLRNDTKKMDFLEIEDCNPAVFSEFLCFLYCKSVDNLTQDNVFDLFTEADKYDVPDLKAKCVEFMKENLTVDTFCDTLTLAMQHSETMLINLTTHFFNMNATKIIVTDKWQSFLTNNPTQGNQLFVKYLESDRS